MSQNRENIQFQSGSECCRGWFYRVSGTDSAPVILMAHGFGAVKEMRLDAYAERFLAAGYNVLTFDYRHFGDSSGMPRQLLSIKKQHQDWRAALKFLRSLTGIDTQKIVLWGTSFSGGHVMQIAHEDKQIAAVISQVPHMNGIATALAGGLVQGMKLSMAACRDIANSCLGRSPYYVGVYGEVGELAAMTAMGEAKKARKLYPKDNPVNEIVAARVFATLVRYSPGKCAPQLTVPLLVQVALQDVTTPPKPAIDAAEKAPKGELVTYDLGHFDVYVEPAFETTITDQLAFLKKAIQ